MSAKSSPTAAARAFFRAVDTDDVPTVISLSADLVEFCDEISGGWARLDRDGVRHYSETLADLVTDSSTEVQAVHERILGDVATVTGTLLQRYVLNGEPREYHLLVSLVFHQEGDAWRLTLGHMTPTETTP